MVKNGAVLCVVLIACSDASAPKHSDAGVHDAGAHVQGTRDSGARDAATGADAMQDDQSVMSLPDAAADSGAPQSCDDRARAISELVIAAIAATDNQCKTDADCVTLQPLKNSCYQGCTVPISRSGADAIGSAVATLERETCPAFVEAGCTAQAPTCPTPSVVSCQGGKCKTVLDPMARTCPNLEQAIRDRSIQAFEQADRHCTVDADCTLLIPANACFKDCRDGLILSVTGAADVQAAIDSAEIDICPSFYAAGCALGNFECAPPDQSFGCIGRTCGPHSMR
jgi:hypothetical protein